MFCWLCGAAQRQGHRRPRAAHPRRPGAERSSPWSSRNEDRATPPRWRRRLHRTHDLRRWIDRSSCVVSTLTPSTQSSRRRSAPVTRRANVRLRRNPTTPRWLPPFPSLHRRGTEPLAGRNGERDSVCRPQGRARGVDALHVDVSCCPESAGKSIHAASTIPPLPSEIMLAWGCAEEQTTTPSGPHRGLRHRRRCARIR